MLETMAIGDLRGTSLVREHSATCEQCARIITLISHGESDLAVALDNGASRIDADVMAAEAIRIARRRRVTHVVSSLLAVAFAVTLWMSYVRVIAPAVRNTASMVGPHLNTESLDLKCLSPTQAGELIQPYVRSSGSAYYPGKEGMHVITVRGTAEELAASKSVLDRYDRSGSAACEVTRAPRSERP